MSRTCKFIQIMFYEMLWLSTKRHLHVYVFGKNWFFGVSCIGVRLSINLHKPVYHWSVVVNGLQYFTKNSFSFIHSLPHWITRSPKVSSGLSLSYRGYDCKSEKCFCACTVYMSHLFMICVSLRLYFLQRGP